MKKIKRSQKRGDKSEQINSYLIEDANPRAIPISKIIWSFEDIDYDACYVSIDIYVSRSIPLKYL